MLGVDVLVELELVVEVGVGKTGWKSVEAEEVANESDA